MSGKPLQLISLITKTARKPKGRRYILGLVEAETEDEIKTRLDFVKIRQRLRQRRRRGRVALKPQLEIRSVEIISEDELMERLNRVL